ncbi:MAG: hypothetical protein GWN71_16210 [Gammaproteobacteria bacterium]|nr:hypothetical protein [Gemmatimonadota bacterium]NIU75064.1 hypothetical protein [Gammaproteobacteria bacterium]
MKKGAVGASGLAAGSAGCAPLLTGAGLGSGGTDVSAYLEQFDRATLRLQAWDFSTAFPDYRGDRAALDTVGRNAIRTLYVTGMFGDLPIEGQVHPAVQERMWAAQPVLDGTIDAMTTLLSGMTPEDHARLQRGVRTHPDVVERLVEVVDAQAAVSGLSEARREQFRSQVQHVTWRLENQPPRLLIDEYLTKVRKVSAAEVETAAYQRWLTARVGEEAFWQEEQSKRDRRISGGLRTMGIGAIILGASGLLLLVASGADIALGIGAVGATVGSIFILVGLIRLLLGLATSRDAG